MKISKLMVNLVLMVLVIPLILLGCSLPGIAPKVPPLDETTLERVYIGGPDQLQPGQSQVYKLLELTGGPADPPVKDANVAWDVVPGAMASMDRRSGELKVKEDAPHDAILTVTADVDDGRRVITKSILIYSLDQNPLVGTWNEIKQITCDTYLSVPSDPEFGMSIRELIFNADGTYSVTWRPFERYHDYWGTYDVWSEGGSMTLTITRGNYIPKDFDGEGSISFSDQDNLVMVDFWLGSPMGKSLPAQCGYVFARP